MNQAWCLAAALIFHATIYSAKCDAPPGGVRCYDCNYDPGEHPAEAGISSDRGFPRCALRRPEDRQFVDGWQCTSGTCFLRKDPNGMVYRGCADRWNLPWGVDTSTSCSLQGQTAPSLWWFCEGDLCNHGKFGDQGVCPKSTGQSVDRDAEVENSVVDISTGDGYAGDEDLHGYDDIMVHANSFDEGTYLNDVPAPYYDFQPMFQAEDQENMENNVDTHQVDRPEIPDGPQPYFQDFPSNRDESLSYRPYVYEDSPMLYEANGPEDIPLSYNGNGQVDTPFPESLPAPVPLPADEYQGPPPLMNQEFQVHYQSLIPRGDREHTAGFGPLGAGDGGKKQADHKSLKSWQPEKSVDNPESYHKSWEGSDFSVSFAGEGVKSENVKSSAESVKSEQSYEGHSKSGYNGKSEKTEKSTKSKSSGSAEKSHDKSHQTPPYISKSENAKTDYVPKSNSPKAPPKTYDPIPSKSHDYSIKSSSGYKSQSGAPQSEYDHAKSHMPKPKSQYIAPQLKSMPKTDFNPQKSSVFQPTPSKYKSVPQKSDYKSLKSHYGPTKSNFYPSKAQHVPLKSDHVPPKSYATPLKSDYNLPNYQPDYNSGKKSRPFGSKSDHSPMDKSFLAPMSKYTPPKVPLKSHYAQSDKSQDMPPSKKTSPPKSHHAVADYPPKSLPDPMVVPVPYPDVLPMPLPADLALPPLYPGPVIPKPAPGPYLETPEVRPRPVFPDYRGQPVSRLAESRDTERRDGARGTSIGSPGQDNMPNLRSTQFGDYWYQHYYRGDRETRRPREASHEEEEAPPVVDNPCSADCGSNPSGLFPHPTRLDWFIQCGAGMDDYGASCGCCKPNYLRCPDGTTFDLVSRVCGTLTDRSHYRG